MMNRLVKTDSVLSALDRIQRWAALPAPERLHQELGEAILPLSLHWRSAFLLHAGERLFSNPETVLGLLKERGPEAAALYEEHFPKGGQASVDHLLHTVLEGRFWNPSDPLELGVRVGDPRILPEECPIILSALVALEGGGYGEVRSSYGVSSLENIFPVGIPFTISIGGADILVHPTPSEWKGADRIFDFLLKGAGLPPSHDEVEIGAVIGKRDPSHRRFSFTIKPEGSVSRSLLEYHDDWNLRRHRYVKILAPEELGGHLLAALVEASDKGAPSSPRLKVDPEGRTSPHYFVGPGFLGELGGFNGSVANIPLPEAAYVVRHFKETYGPEHVERTEIALQGRSDGLSTRVFLDFGGMTKEEMRIAWWLRPAVGQASSGASLLLMGLDEETQGLAERVVHENTRGVFLTHRWNSSVRSTMDHRGDA